MASDTGASDDADVKRTVEDPDVLEQKEKTDIRLATLSKNINACNAVLDDLKALRDILKRKSLQDLHLRPQKETEEPFPKTSS